MMMMLLPAGACVRVWGRRDRQVSSSLFCPVRQVCYSCVYVKSTVVLARTEGQLERTKRFEFRLQICIKDALGLPGGSLHRPPFISQQLYVMKCKERPFSISVGHT